MGLARYGAFWSNQKMERVAGDAFFFFLLVPWPATAHLCRYAHFQPNIRNEQFIKQPLAE
jgi:hypothetical protein